jgi:polyphosphate kinase
MRKTDGQLTTINRDISWMYFNRRILDEAANKDNPLLERLKFIGIYSNNLDEYFSVRVATLMRMVEIEKNISSIKSDSNKVLKKILKLNEQYTSDLEAIYNQLILELKEENIYFLNEKQLDKNQVAYIEGYYRSSLMSHLYPILASRMEEAPKLIDKDIYLAVKISKKEALNPQKSNREYALIQIPTYELSRFVILPSKDKKIQLMFLDDVIRLCLPQIFASLNFDTYEAYTIKFTRDSEMDFDKSAYQSLLEKVSKAVKNRRFGSPVRFVFDRDIPKSLLSFTAKWLNIDKDDAHIAGNRYHNLKDFINFPDVGRPDLKFTPRPPLQVPAFDEVSSLIQLIRQKDHFLHYPYQQFDYFIRLLREAAISPEVKAIKISIYRLAKNSKIIKALINAAMNGKKVTANVELLARFDESSNINWAQKMEEAGINVIFGVEGLKVHSKLALIKTRSNSLACISTGNFHEGTAGIYTDFTLMTARPSLVEEVDKVFTFIEHPYTNPSFKELIVSPNFTRRKLMALINKEIENAKKRLPAYILFKINHVVDEKIIRKLYQAAAAGVTIKLLVRGSCSITTGPQGGSETIEVYGIVDRYLEHARILIFANGGDEKYYIGSGDLMTRNLDNRIEVFAPIYDEAIQQQLKKTIEYGLRDNVKARIVDGSGLNRINPGVSTERFRSQEELYQNYYNAIRELNLQSTIFE